MNNADQDKLAQLVTELKQQLSACVEMSDVEQLRSHYLGKQGQITQMLKSLSTLAPDVRRSAGQAINATKVTLQQLCQQRIEVIKAAKLEQQLAAQAVDVSLAGRGQTVGSLHPITLSMQRIERFFKARNFEVAQGPEIEDDFHNFNALNIPPLHPARAMQDTFYLGEHALLRTHTSTVQIHTMQALKPPIRIIAPGPAYRCDFDATHSPMFHQVEGLVVDEGINFAHMKHLLKDFLNYFFGRELATRFRSSYFPFTEPSAEIDVQCMICLGEDPSCRVCKGSGWLEVLGCGMVHPNVLSAVDIDHEHYTGFAFGAGIERLTMLRYQIADLRLLFDNDVRMLQQFGSRETV